MKHIIKQILREDISNKVINKTVSLLEQNKIKPPYFKNLKDIDLSPEEIKMVLEKFTGGIVDLNLTDILYEQGKSFYSEYHNGVWEKIRYDERGNRIYYEDSNGYWVKREYNHNNDVTYWEDNDGYWEKFNYNKEGELSYVETSSGEIIYPQN